MRPLGSASGLSVMGGQGAVAAITMEYSWLPEQPFVSVAVIVKLKVPAVAGVPVMAPVAVLSDNTGGSAPLETAYVYGVAVLPEAVTV